MKSIYKFYFTKKLSLIFISLLLIISSIKNVRADLTGVSFTNANDFEKFKTDEYVPIPEDSAIDPSNVIAPAANYGGSIYNVLIDAAGTGYLANTEFDIIGDGTNAKIRITSTNQSGGTYLYMAFAEHPFNGNGEGAFATAR